VFYHGNLRRKKYGGFAEYAVHDASTTCKASKDHISLAVQLAAIPCAGWTAYHACFKKLKLLDECKHVGYVLVTGASGGVGGFAVQLIRHLINDNTGRKNKITIIATCSAKNAEFVKKLGVHHVIDYTSENIEERVMQITDNVGVDAWIDTVGPDSVAQGIKCLAFAGEIVSIVGSPAVPMNSLMGKALSIHHVALGAAHAHDKNAKADLVQMGNHMYQMLVAGKLDAMVNEVIPIEQVKHGLEQLQTRHVRGKIVVQVASQ
jgi:NADPH:quinone reductase-like Zn-dependent oxidoreductase